MAHARGGCYVCLRGDRLVDLDVQIEGEGALVLCTPCIQDAAEAADLALNGAAVSELRAELIEANRAADATTLAAELAESEAALATAENTIATLQDVIDRIGSDTQPAARRRQKVDAS
jgi:hypothetical protein